VTSTQFLLIGKIFCPIDPRRCLLKRPNKISSTFYCRVHKSCFLYQPHSAPKSLSDCRFLIRDLNGSHLFVFITKQTLVIHSNTTQFILIQLVNLVCVCVCVCVYIYICYMFRPVLRASSGMSIQNPYKGI